MKVIQKCGELWSPAAKNTQQGLLKLPQPSVKKEKARQPQRLRQ